MAAKPYLTLTGPRDVWAGMLAVAGRIANPKPIPPLACVRLEAHGSGVGWWVTDTRVSRGGDVALQASGPGVGLLSVATALAMVKSCADGPVQIAFMESGDATLKAGTFSARIPGFPLADFPMFPDRIDGGVAIPREVLARLVAEVRPSIDGGSSRYYLRGALLQVTGETAVAVSTDGHQLSRSRASLTAAPGEPVDAIIAAEALAHLAAMLNEHEAADVLCAVGPSGHSFSLGSDYVTARPVEGQFPAYERVLPKAYKGRAECDREALAAAVKRVAISSDAAVPRVALAFEGDELKLSARSVGRGDSADVVPISREGAEVSCVLNARYVQNFLGLAQTERVAIEYTSGTDAVLFRPIGQSPTDYVHVVMTMRD